MELLTLFAILLSPLIAVQATAWLQRRRNDRDRRMHIFRTLMGTRAAGLDPNHVAALNMIDVEFYGKDRKSRAVVEACRVYLEHHNRGNVAAEAWGDKRVDLLLDLLQKMGESLGYEMDRVSIRNTSYFPRGYGDQEYESRMIRKYFLDLLEGKRWLPIFATTPNDAAQGEPPPQAPQKELEPGPPPETQTGGDKSSAST